jgi:hypothetical protein
MSSNYKIVLRTREDETTYKTQVDINNGLETRKPKIYLKTTKNFTCEY